MTDTGTDRTLDETEVAYAGVEGQAALLRSGRLTSRELVEILLRRIERLEPRLNAFRLVLADEARRDAAAADAARQAGDQRPLLGVPIAVKDNVSLAGTASLLGSASPEAPAARDGELVSRLRAAGMVILGKTNLPELALWGHTESLAHGVTRNPWAPTRTPGGSSGGSAAAVAAGLVPAAHATDGLGSIRIPAASCGLVGLKPGPGRVPMEPDPHWDGLSFTGFLTRTVADTALLLDAVGAGDDVRPAPPRRLRVGISTRAPIPTRVHRDVRRGWQSVTEVLRGMGHEVRTHHPPYGQTSGPAGLVRSWLTGSRRDLALLADPAVAEPRTRRLASVGRAAEPMLGWARRSGEKTTARLQKMFDDIDVLVLPATATLPPAAGRDMHRGLARSMLANMRFAPFAAIWNVGGQPALVVPSGVTAEGVPVAVQLVARLGNESTLLGLAAALERELAWPARRPPLD